MTGRSRVPLRVVAIGTSLALVASLLGSALALAAAPVAQDDGFSVAEDGTLSRSAANGVLSNDTDADLEPLTAVLVDDVSDGTLTLDDDGGLTYDPDPDFNGTDSFTYRANDGIDDSNLATVTITITPVNDPPVADAADASALDPKVFGGKAMTYYGRWTYKYEKAAELGAAAVFIVHETAPAGYPFNVVQGFAGERFNLITPDKNLGRAAIQGWLSLDAATALLKAAGHDYQALKARGLSHTRASLTIARKLARRSYHVLRELGPAALEPVTAD